MGFNYELKYSFHDLNPSLFDSQIATTHENNLSTVESRIPLRILIVVRHHCF